jgi:hypothetical protein
MWDALFTFISNCWGSLVGISGLVGSVCFGSSGILWLF